jgi:hypothetical protein
MFLIADISRGAAAAPDAAQQPPPPGPPSERDKTFASYYVRAGDLAQQAISDRAAWQISFDCNQMNIRGANGLPGAA